MWLLTGSKLTVEDEAAAPLPATVATCGEAARESLPLGLSEGATTETRTVKN